MTRSANNSHPDTYPEMCVAERLKIGAIPMKTGTGPHPLGRPFPKTLNSPAVAPSGTLGDPMGALGEPMEALGGPRAPSGIPWGPSGIPWGPSGALRNPQGALGDPMGPLGGPRGAHGDHEDSTGMAPR